MTTTVDANGIEDFEGVLRGELIRPEDPNFNEARAIYNR